MAWRFKVSKYKNAAPKFPKKEELIQEVQVGNAAHSCGNNIKASCVYMVFNVDSSTGGSLGFLPLNAKGRVGNDVSFIHAHGDFVSDFDFSPFDDYMLATGSQNNAIKVWLLPEESSMSDVSDAKVVLPSQNRRIENVVWHPTAEGVLAVSTDTCVKLFDVATATEKAAFSQHGDQVQSMSWRGDGTVMVTTCRDKQLRVLDLRNNQLAQEVKGHQNTKDTRVLWLGSTDYILSTGFGSTQDREIKLWDSRNLSSELTAQSAGGSTGALMCFFDEDTNMIFFAGKSDNSISFMELTEKSPYLNQGMVDRTEQIKGAAMVPKRALDLMSGEVNRILLLAKNAIHSVPYIVPRKSYRDFHSDLYPDTFSGEPALTSNQWFSGENTAVSKVALNPKKDLIKRERRGALFGLTPTEPCMNGSQDTGVKTEELSPIQVERTPSPKPTILKQKPKLVQNNSIKPSPHQSATPASNASTPPLQSDQPPSEPAKPAKVFKGVRQSKYRYISAKISHPSQHLTNLKHISNKVPIESDFFAANSKSCAVPLDGPGGVIAVLRLDKPGRLGDTADELPTIQNGSKVADLVWDPFDDDRLVVACDNAKINVWRVPPEGLPVGLSESEPEFSLRGHMEKIYFAKFHPLVKDILMSASYDMTVRMWNLDTRSEVMQLKGHQDQVFSLAWSSCGRLCATICKDGMLRVFEPRKSDQPIKEAKSPGGTRGARLIWVLDGRFIFISGFDETSQEQRLFLFSAESLEMVGVEEVHRTPSILVPYYDPDSSTVFLFSRGERTVHNYEISEESPHLFGNATMNLQTMHQGLSFVPRRLLDVRAVEVARAWRLTNTSVESVSFSVPRARMEYFQDDLYPDTLVTWEPALEAEEWLSGKDPKPKYVSLRPRGMKLLSEAPVEAPKAQKYESFNSSTYKSDEQKKDELMSAMVGKLELSTEPLPQQLAEGVEDNEWDD